MAFQEHNLSGYNNHSDWQLKTNLQALPEVLERLKAIENVGLIKIADFGCSEGRNSIVFFRKLLESFYSDSQTPVQIFHTDLPENDWKVFNNTIANSDISYLSLPNTFFATIGKSFFTQLFPSNSIHLSYAAYSFHYLSTKVIKEPDDTSFPQKAFLHTSSSF